MSSQLAVKYQKRIDAFNDQVEGLGKQINRLKVGKECRKEAQELCKKVHALARDVYPQLMINLQKDWEKIKAYKIRGPIRFGDHKFSKPYGDLEFIRLKTLLVENHNGVKDEPETPYEYSESVFAAVFPWAYRR